MNTTRWLAGLTFFGAATIAGALSASDVTAVYARIDKVVLERDGDSPKRVQVWGVFALAKSNNVNDYLPATRGYLYFVLAANPQAALKEWSDLQTVSGTGQIVAFGSRWEMKSRVRPADERPADPDPYPVGIGVTRISGRTDYAPVRSLLDSRP